VTSSITKPLAEWAFFSLWRFAIVVIAAVCLCGCATETADLPWNTPQSWEGAPNIPGFSDRQ